MSIEAIQVVSVPVSDQTAAKRFYVEVLGFEVVRDSPFTPDARWIELSPRPGSAAIALVTWFAAAPPGSLQGTVLRCSDIDSDYDRLSRAGVAFSGPIQAAPWGRYATFGDPDGNGWVLQQNAEMPDADASRR